MRARRTRETLPVTVIVTVVALLTACASTGSSRAISPGRTTAASMATNSTPSPSPSPAGGSTAFGRSELVTGTMTFTLTDGDLVTGADGTVHARKGTAQVRLTCSDPRLTATGSESWESDRWGTGAGNGALVQWGRSRYTNAGGSWAGHYSGVYTSSTSDLITWWLEGEGGYQGLSVFLWITESNSGRWQGLIFPGTPPSPNG
jgi:hypothetical protein